MSLLIVPVGIEILLQITEYTMHYILLIVPVGIEISSKLIAKRPADVF